MNLTSPKKNVCNGSAGAMVLLLLHAAVVDGKDVLGANLFLPPVLIAIVLFGILMGLLLACSAFDKFATRPFEV